MRNIEFVVDREMAGERLDLCIVRYLPTFIEQEVSRSQAQKLIESSLVSVDKKIELKSSYRLRGGESVLVIFEKQSHERIVPQEIPLSILYEDQHLICINKPAGLTVHPGAGQKDGTLLNALAHYLKQEADFNQERRPWVVHRLDKDTSGVLIVAKNDHAHRLLSKQFQERRVVKEYRALVLVTPRMRNNQLLSESGVIEKPIGRHPTQRTKMSVSTKNGRSALTRWQVVERFHFGALLSVIIETGRTHQIRVHFESIGAPVIGDKVYGNFSVLPKVLFKAQQLFARQALQAYSITFTHPISDKAITVVAPLDSEFNLLLSRWRSYEPS